MKKVAIIVFFALLLAFITACITLSIVKNKEYEETINRVDAKIERYENGKGVR